MTGPVYLAGETITCQVSVVNNAATTQVSFLWGSALNCGSLGFLKSRFQVLAWASASLHCFCTVSDSKVAVAQWLICVYACRGRFSPHESLLVLTAIVCRLPFLTGRSLGSPAPRIHQIAHPFRLMNYQLSSDLIGLIVSEESLFFQQPCAGEAGLPVLSTPTKILFCDLTLAPGERQVAEYQETIPPSASPSYRGTSVKYSYKVVQQKMCLKMPDCYK